jgi:copper(I)-binding protein
MKRRAAALLLLALLFGGCVYYPTIGDVGGIRIRPKNSRAVANPSGFAIYMDLDSTGAYGDAILGATTDIAKTVVLVIPIVKDQPLPYRIDVPAATLVRLTPQGPHFLLSDLTRAVAPGEVVLITVLFEKVGRIGVPTRIE